jgi:hypothetical protein
MQLPVPGLQGDYRDSCVVCFQGCDTAVAFRGEAEWVVAGLSVLGVPMDQAATTVSMLAECEPGMCPEGQMTVAVRVCEACHAKSRTGFPVGVVGEPLRPVVRRA